MTLKSQGSVKTQILNRSLVVWLCIWLT
jgi:hypothetical protein